MSWVLQSQPGARVLKWFSAVFAPKSHLQNFEKSTCQGHTLTASESPWEPALGFLKVARGSPQHSWGFTAQSPSASPPHSTPPAAEEGSCGGRGGSLSPPDPGAAPSPQVWRPAPRGSARPCQWIKRRVARAPALIPCWPLVLSALSI